jgi:hypothetical protein
MSAHEWQFRLSALPEQWGVHPIAGFPAPAVDLLAIARLRRRVRRQRDLWILSTPGPWEPLFPSTGERGAPRDRLEHRHPLDLVAWSADLPGMVR